MDKKNERPEAYPKPTQTDQQMKSQDEYTERQSSRTSEDLPVHGGTGNDPSQSNNSNNKNTQSGEQIR
jgi:hypothetical protein